MQHWPKGSRSPQAGKAEWFSGEAQMTALHQAQEPARANAVNVDFAQGARTAWHTHPLGQIIIITAGRGLAQAWEGPVLRLEPGDVVWFPPGEKHWHGAAANASMSHIAIQEGLDGVTVNWLEHVTKEDYADANAAANV